MKFCSKCGVQNDDKVLFCTNCGNKFETETKNEFQQPAPQPQYQPYYQPQPQPQPQQYQPSVLPGPRVLSSDPAVNMLKKISASPLFLGIAAAYSILVLLRFIKIFADNLSSYGFGINVVGIFLGIIGWIIPALIGLGLWLHFTAANNSTNNYTNDNGLKTTGLTIIKVCVIINLVFLCITLLLCFIVWIILMIALLSAGSFAGAFGYFDGMGAAVGIIIASFVILVIAAVLSILYYAKVIGTISRLTECALTGQTRKLPVYVPVIHFISAFFSLLSIAAMAVISSVIGDILNAVLYELPSEINFAGDMIYNSVSGIFGISPLYLGINLLDAVLLVLISVAILTYNSKLKQLEYSNPAPSNNPYYQQPQPPAYNQNANKW